MALVAVAIAALASFDFITIQDFAIQEGTLRIRYAKFAEMAIMLAPMMTAAALAFRDRAKSMIASVVAAAAWLAVMLSLSKGAFLAGIIGFVLLFSILLLTRRDMFRKVAVACTLWIIFTVLFQFGISSLTSVPSTVNYISGAADTSRSTSDMRIYTWKVSAEMIAANLFTGVGADNFGLAFNDSRRTLAEADPSDPDSAIGEYYLFERAHNEPLQIFAELGIVGIGTFVAIVAAAVFIFGGTLRRNRRPSPMFVGGLSAMAAFALSSLVSSFSFRAFQNGIVFFVVLGFTIGLARLRPEPKQSRSWNAWKHLRPLLLATPVLLFAFSAIKAVSQYTLYFGERAPDLKTAREYFQTAAWLDPDNPGAELAAAESLARKELWAESVPHFRRAIDRGFGVSVIYSYLANAQEKSGDLAEAELTLTEASKIFPRSTFIRVRLAIVLEELGRIDDAGKHLAEARAFDARQANGWYAVIKEGIMQAHLKATEDPKNYAAPPELLPENAIHAYNTDRVQVH